MKTNILLLTIAAFYAQMAMGANSGLNPSSLKLKVYKFAVSTSELCTNPVTVFTNSSPTYKDVYASPNFGSGLPTPDTYKCVIIEFSDQIKYVPATTSTSGNCVAGTEYTLDVCRSGSTSTLADGTSVTCNTSATEDRVGIYISTGATSTGGGSGNNAFAPPSYVGDSASGLNLGSALVVTTSGSGQLIVNGAGKVEDSGAACDHQPPLFSFR